VPSSGTNFTDIQVGALNQALPQSIKPLAVTTLQAVQNARTANGDYINAFVNRDQKLIVARTANDGGAGVTAPTNAPNSNFWIAPAIGDSGFPIFFEVHWMFGHGRSMSL
jgi:hypothetical protein